MQKKNSPERHTHPDSDDEDHIHIDTNDAFEIIDIDPTAEEMVEDRLDDLELAPTMEEEEEEEDDARLTVSRHKPGSSVFSIALDPQSQLRVCSGGEDDRCLLWRFDTGDLIHEYPTFDDSVHQVCWSFDGKYLCACDMRGQIRCWTSDANGVPTQEIWSFHTGSDIELMRFHPSAHVLLVGTNDSQLWLFKIPSGEYKIMHGGSDTELLTLEILANGKSFSVASDDLEYREQPDRSFSSLGKQCLCGYGNGQIKLWDLKQCSIVWQYDSHGEGEAETTVNLKCISMCLNDEQTLAACGFADGNCRVLNLNSGKLLASFACCPPSTTSSSSATRPSEAHSDEEEEEEEDESTATTIESVAFGANHLLVCGTLSGYIYLWDINTKQLRTTLNLQSGIVKCLLNEGYLLYTACLDGHIRLLDIRNGEPLKEWKSGGGQGCEIMDMLLTKDKRHLLCAYMQGSCRVFQLKE